MFAVQNEKRRKYDRKNRETGKIGFPSLRLQVWPNGRSERRFSCPQFSCHFFPFFSHFIREYPRDPAGFNSVSFSSFLLNFTVKRLCGPRSVLSHLAFFPVGHRTSRSSRPGRFFLEVPPLNQQERGKPAPAKPGPRGGRFRFLSIAAGGPPP